MHGNGPPSSSVRPAAGSHTFAGQPVSTVIFGPLSALDYRVVSPGCLGLGLLSTPCTGTADWLENAREKMTTPLPCIRVWDRTSLAATSCNASQKGMLAEDASPSHAYQACKANFGKGPKSPLTQRWCAPTLAAGSPGQGPSASRASPCKQPPTAKGGWCTQNFSPRGGANL